MSVEQDGEKICSRHRGGRVTRPGGITRPHRIHSQLLAELTPKVFVSIHDRPPIRT